MTPAQTALGPLKLMGVLAHPDDESLGIGGTLAKYAGEGVETYLVTATRGERGRFGESGEKPPPDVVGRVREAELREAARVLGVREVNFLDYYDGDLDRVNVTEAIARIVDHLRRVKPQVVITFGPEGAYGHPDHIAISQLTTAAVVAAAGFNGHPRFFGYITSSPAPLGALGDFLAAMINQNVGAFRLSPLATEIEAQTVRWIAELIGYPSGCGGLLVSGGNMANFVCFLAARAAKATWDVRTKGLAEQPRLLAYASTETHTWLQKAADLFGFGSDAIRWIPVDAGQRMNSAALESQIDRDLARGDLPFLVVGTAGSVSTGAVDPLLEIAAICRARKLWFHVDGAYGALAAQVPGAPESLRALNEADSVAVDPHKWLYAPLEAGCVLVRRPDDLLRAFSYHTAYYHFDETAVNYLDQGPQNSRGFRALKVWLALRQVGRTGAIGMIADDMRLSQHLDALVRRHPEFEAFTQQLSVTTFRYVPSELKPQIGSPTVEKRIDEINQALLTRVEKSGEAFLSNAVVNGKFALRVCIVNFRTSLVDIEAIPPLLSRLGKDVCREFVVGPGFSPPDRT